MANDQSAATPQLVGGALARKSAQFIRGYLLTTLFWGPLVYLYLAPHSGWWPLLVFLPPAAVVAVSARGWVRPSRRAAQVLMALTVLIAAFYIFCGRGTEALAGGLYNSDTLAFPALCQSLMHGEPVSGWVFGGPNFLFPDMVAYFLLNVLIPNFRLAFIWFGVLQILAVLCGFALLEATAFPESRNKPLRLFVFVALLAYLAHDNAYIGLGTLLKTGHHVGAIISLLFGLWLILRMIRSELDRRSLLAYGLALFLVTLLTTVSDALFVVQFVAPAMATLAMMWLFGLVERRKLALLTSTLTAGALGGRLIYGRVFMRPELRGYFKISPYHISKSLEAVRTFLQQPDGQHILLGLLILLSIAACVGLILVHIRRLRLQRAGIDGNLVCLSGFMVFLCLSNLSAILISPAVSDWIGLVRYTIPLALLPLLFLSTVTQYALQAVAVDLSRPVRLALLLVLPLLVVLAVQKLPNIVRLAGYYPKWVNDLDREFAKRDLKFGMAQYWQAKYFSLFSKNGVQVVQVTSSLEPFPWMNHRDWYRCPFEFIITDESVKKVSERAGDYLAAERIVSRFGPPDEVFTCGSNTVSVYKNGRLHGCFR